MSFVVRLACIVIISLACFWSISALAQEHHGEEVGEENEEIVVRATRTGRRVQEEPIRVDVINREEIEESS